MSEQIIDLPVETLGCAIDELSYVMGVVDINGDSKMDFVIRTWSESQSLKNDIETRS